MQQEESTMFIQSFLYKRNGSSDTYIVSSCFFFPHYFKLYHKITSFYISFWWVFLFL